MATLAERAEDGRERRTASPPDGMATWAPASDRRPTLDVLIAGDADRMRSWCRSATDGWSRRPSPSSAGSAAVMAGAIADGTVVADRDH
jgi:hypothetical protein